MNETTSSPNRLLAVDSHVHLHDRSNLVPLLDNALTAFTRASKRHKQTDEFSGVLALTEPEGRDTFAQLKIHADSNEGPYRLHTDWTLSTTAEDLSLVASHSSNKQIFLVCGQQIVTAEKLEVLSFFSPQTVQNRLPLRDTIKKIEEIGGFPILPWGVGKWLFGRGRLVSQVIRDPGNSKIAIGDNGSRPAFWSRVTQFEEADKHGLPLLHGSDPLRVSETRRGAGSAGDLIVCPFDSSKPGQSLVNAFKENRFERSAFGTPEPASSFIRDQIALRLK